MKILFLTLSKITSIEDRGIYPDLIRKFRDEGHHITIVSPVERRVKLSTQLIIENGVSILLVKTLNIQKTNFIEKGIGTLAIEYQYLSAIRKLLFNTKFDLVLYSTPPITFYKVVKYIKKRDNAYTYLLLKDIFPQNAVDMKMIKKDGLLHKYFLKKEKKLYSISDTIGCMSPANVDFLLKHNPEVNPNKVEVNPNTIEPIHFNFTQEEKNKIRKRYDVPLDKKILVYGGNLGKPQGLDFLLDTIKSVKNKEIFFLIVGDGTEFSRIKSWFDSYQPQNAKLLQHLFKEDYDKLLAACDVGLIYLDKNFLIPNFPSRLLSYLEMKLPVIAATDVNTDIGDIIEKANCGYKILAGDLNSINVIINEHVADADLSILGENSWKLLQKEYTVKKSYQLIMQKL
ncbi:glycosyltransferase family 4 protein [Pedobacter nototheniae]|uniref:glycosyltransferase family 4 protein n=1 Tax=Pedobacter nototheniae TaxID=2488994 RepID=UPI00292E1EA0|nr:glycosyltransferase family 4 protein [Pedobacter nototheniae]